MGNRVLVCDKDKDYVRALTAYLMSLNFSNRSFEVTGISEEESITSLSGDYEAVLVSEDLKNAVESNTHITRQKYLVLKESREDLKEDNFYKYQNTDTLVSLLCPNTCLEHFEKGDKNSRLVGIYSPSKHELVLPYALCLCRELSKEGKTLFIDLSEIGILPAITGDTGKEDLVDLIFMLENQGFKGDISRFITEYEGVFLLSPTSSPSQFSYITPAQWKGLFEKIKESGFKNIVVLFGNLVQGFSELARELKSLLVIKKPGEFYSLAEGVFMDFMEKIGSLEICKEVTIPLSISGTLQGPFRMSGLINGKLREYVRLENVTG